MKTHVLCIAVILSVSISASGADHSERTRPWNLNGNSGTVPGPDFLGTTDDRALELKVNGSRALRLEPHTNSPSVIGGYNGNFVSPGVAGATISGGGGIYFDEDRPGVVLTNVVSADFGTVSGGNGNHVQGVGGVIAGGQGNQTDTNTWYSFIGGGILNTIQTNGFYSVISGGELGTVASSFSVLGGGIENIIENYSPASVIGGGGHNRIRSDAQNPSFVGSSVIGGGLANEIEAPFGTIPGGWLARVSSLGQFAYASGGFDGGGQAQTSLFVLRQQTTDSTTKELFLDYPNYPPQGRMNIPPSAKWCFDILVVAANATGETASFQLKGAIKNVGSATTLVGAPSTTSLGVDAAAAAWRVSVEADNAHQALIIKATGDSTPIRWVASVRTVELVF